MKDAKNKPRRGKGTKKNPLAAGLQRSSNAARASVERVGSTSAYHATHSARLIEVKSLVLDGAAQPRSSMLSDVVSAYAERMVFDEARRLVLDPEGEPWAPIVVFHDSSAPEVGFLVADGFHRAHAASQAGLALIQCEVRQGGAREAFVYSLGVNATHGQPRTNLDKRRVVERALRDASLRTHTNARLGALCKVSAPFIAAMRRELELSEEIPFEPVLYGKGGREYERDESELLELEGARARQRSSPEPPRAQVSPKPKVPKKKAATLAFSAALAEAQEALDGASTFIAYPVGGEDWEALATWIEGLATTRPELVLAPQESGNELVWRAPQIMSALEAVGYEPVRAVCIEAHKQVYWAWARSERAARVDAWVKDPEALGVNAGEVRTAGVVLHEWP